MASYIAAIDQGTTSTRFMVFDRGGNVVSSAQKEHEQIYPKPGWVEHDPQEILRRTGEVITEALAQKGLRGSDLAAVGITNQRETTVVWNRNTGEPVYNAIVWQDLRVADDVAKFSQAGGADRFRAKTGLPISTYFSALKLRWILTNVPGARKQAESGDLLFGTMDTFLAWHLTGGPQGGLHITDVTNASRTQLMNLSTLAWDRDILKEFEIPEAVLPKICPSSGMLGEIRHPALAGIQLCGILGDQQAALVGQVCFQPGEAKNTYGTGCFLLMNTGERPVQSKHGLVTTVAYQLAGQPARYALEGSIAITGALVQWLRDNLGMIQTSDQIETLARTVDDNGGVYFVPAFSGMFAPYWNDRARGIIVGLTRYVNKGHYGASGAGSHGLPDPRRRGGHGEGLGRQFADPACGWRDGRERSPDAVSGGHFGADGGASGDAGDDRAGRRLRGRFGKRLLQGHFRFTVQLVRGSYLVAGHGCRRARDTLQYLEESRDPFFGLGRYRNDLEDNS